MKIHQIIAVLAMVFGLGGAFVAYSFSGLSAELITNGSISLVSSILGLLGIYLFEKDYKIAIVQYIICGIGVLVGTSLFGTVYKGRRKKDKVYIQSHSGADRKGSECRIYSDRARQRFLLRQCERRV